MYHLYYAKQSATPIDIQLLMSGHAACGEEIDETGNSNNNADRNDSNNQTEEINHEYNNAAGIASWVYRIAVVFNSDLDSYYKQTTLLHELGHCFGAGRGTGSVADQNVSKHADNCVMAYKRNNDDLLDKWEDEYYEDLFCSSCKQEIKLYMLRS